MNVPAYEEGPSGKSTLLILLGGVGLLVVIYVVFTAVNRGGVDGNAGASRAPAAYGDEALACYASHVLLSQALKAPATAKYQPCAEADAMFNGLGEFTVTSYVD